MDLDAVFIIGPPRSGTTLLLDLLSAHPAIDAHGEDFHAFHHDLTIFKDRTESEDHFRLTTAEATTEIASRYRAAIAQSLEQSGRSTFVLKISTLSIQVDYVKALLPEARFVQLVRDGRDTACSMEDLRRALEKDQGNLRPLGPAPDPLGLWCAEHRLPGQVRAAASWAYHVTRSWLDLRFAGPDAYCRVRYEDLLARPHEVVGEVLAFVGVESTSEIDALLALVTDAPGAPGGLGFSSTQAKGSRRVGRFQDDMSAAARVVISPLLELPMRLLGYEPDPWPEVEPFFDACHALGIDPEMWRDRAKAEAAWFEMHHRTFSPEAGLRAGPIPSSGRPLLVDGALVGSQRTLADGGTTNALSWIQKQARRHRFVDPESRWPRIAADLDGSHRVAEIQKRHRLGVEAEALLDQLRGLGFVGLT